MRRYPTISLNLPNTCVQAVKGAMQCNRTMVPWVSLSRDINGGYLVSQGALNSRRRAIHTASFIVLSEIAKLASEKRTGGNVVSRKAWLRTGRF